MISGGAGEAHSSQQVREAEEGMVKQRELSQRLDLEESGHDSVSDVSTHHMGKMMVQPQHW